MHWHTQLCICIYVHILKTTSYKSNISFSKYDEVEIIFESLNDYLNKIVITQQNYPNKIFHRNITIFRMRITRAYNAYMLIIWRNAYNFHRI